MTFEECFETSPILLMEGALVERLRREYHVRFDPAIAMAALVEDPPGQSRPYGMGGPGEELIPQNVRFLQGLQANTSPLPYSELDGAADLHSSAPRNFAAAMVRLQKAAGLKIMGDCCGTDDRHMEAMAAALSK